MCVCVWYCVYSVCKCKGMCNHFPMHFIDDLRSKHFRFTFCEWLLSSELLFSKTARFTGETGYDANIDTITGIVYKLR